MPDYRTSPYRGLKTLRNEIVPWAPFADRGNPDTLIPNQDEVLNYLARQSEQAYQRMEHQYPLVRHGMLRRRRTLLSAGWKIEPGNNSPAARLQADFCEELVKRLRGRWEVVLDCMYYAIFWGWRPLERIWDLDATWKGKPAWFLSAIREKNPWDFRFTQNRDMVYIGGGVDNGREQVFRMEDDEDALRWLICTSGSTSNPYGVADLRFVWLIKYCWSEFFKLLSQGTKRSMGIIEVKEIAPVTVNTLAARDQKAGAGAVGQAKTVEQAGDDFRAALRILEESGILVSRAGWDMSLNSDVKYAEGWKFPLEYVDRLAALCLTGDTLSLSQGQVGSRAAAETKSRECEALCIADGKEIAGWVTDIIFGDCLARQFPDPDPDDAPSFAFELGHEIDLDAAQFLIDNGAELDGRKIASKFGVPLLTDPQPDDVVLKKASPLLGPDGLPLLPGADPGAPQDGAPPDQRTPAGRRAGLLKGKAAAAQKEAAAPS